jgi:hypothetical protein
MNFLDFVNFGMSPAEFQLMLLETALRALSGGAFVVVGIFSVVYFLLWFTELKHERE